MDRERFVGIVVSFRPENSAESVEYVLTRFAGEGNSSIVYDIAPRDNPKAAELVIKFLKPDVRFEMTVLHHSFRIAEELYPDHPLLMSPEERMRRLTDEMLGRIESYGSLFRVDAFSDLLMTTIEVLAREFEPRFRKGELPAEWIKEIDQPIIPMIDDGLVLEIESLLEDNAFANEFEAFFEQILEDLRAAVATAKQSGNFRPLSQSRLFKLLGLHLENFINWDELIAITDSAEFRPSLTVDEMNEFLQTVSILYFRASSKKRGLESSDEEEVTRQTASFNQTLSAGLTAARYLDAVATKYHSDKPKFSAYARNWQARMLLLEDKQTEAMTLFQQVLELPVTEDSQAERHDALIDLAELISESDPARARAYEDEAAGIRKLLGVT
jgi:hypothetical protein